MRQRKEKSTEKFSCVNKTQVKHLTKCQKEEKLQTICPASNSKFNKNILNTYT